MELPEIVWRVIRAVEGADGAVMVVGGAVVDHMLGITPKDFDLEAYHIRVEDLGEALQDFCPKAVGQEFGIFTLSQSACEGVDIDVYNHTEYVDNSVTNVTHVNGAPAGDAQDDVEDLVVDDTDDVVQEVEDIATDMEVEYSAFLNDLGV